MLIFLFSSWILIGCGAPKAALPQQSFGSSQQPVDSGVPTDGNVGGGGVTPPITGGTGRNDSNCLNNSNYDACLIYKNVVTTNRGPLTRELNLSSDLSGFQNWAVDITDLDNSGFLQNSNIQVNITNGSRRRTSQGLNFAANGTDNDRAFVQVSVYHWANRVFNLMESWGGAPTRNQLTTFDAYDESIENNGFFAFDDKGIYMGSIDSRVFTGNGSTRIRQEIALSAEIVIHEYGHAAHYEATNGGVAFYSQNTTRSCPQSSSSNQCCTSSNGCSLAIIEASADILSSFVFPENPSVGDVFVNDPDGNELFGATRSPEVTGNRSVASLFSSPGNSGFSDQWNGEIYTLGYAYSSAWYAVWKAAERSGQEEDIHAMFLDHLSLVSSSDTFVTMLEKLVTLSDTLYDGTHTQRFLDEFAARGIRPN